MNADQYASTGQGLIGNNMFAYCGNSSILKKDPAGKWTLSISIGANITAIVGLSAGIGLAFDGDGGIAVQWNYSEPTHSSTATGGLFDVGVALQAQWTNKKTVDDLNGIATYIGASGGVLGYAGVDLVSDSPVADLGGDACGGQVSAGLGYGIDIHLAQTKTKTIVRTSWKKVFKRIMELF